MGGATSVTRLRGSSACNACVEGWATLEGAIAENKSFQIAVNQLEHIYILSSQEPTNSRKQFLRRIHAWVPHSRQIPKMNWNTHFSSMVRANDPSMIICRPFRPSQAGMERIKYNSLQMSGPHQRERRAYPGILCGISHSSTLLLGLPSRPEHLSMLDDKMADRSQCTFLGKNPFTQLSAKFSLLSQTTSS
jgi:hypothetical protein